MSEKSHRHMSYRLEQIYEVLTDLRIYIKQYALMQSVYRSLDMIPMAMLLLYCTGQRQ